MAAWAFAAAGLGAGLGVATATVYGVLALAATLPGAPLIAAAWLQRRRGHRPGAGDPLPRNVPASDSDLVPVAASAEGSVHG